jgi:hypothetical protein
MPGPRSLGHQCEESIVPDLPSGTDVLLTPTKGGALLQQRRRHGASQVRLVRGLDVHASDGGRRGRHGPSGRNEMGQARKGRSGYQVDGEGNLIGPSDGADLPTNKSLDEVGGGAKEDVGGEIAKEIRGGKKGRVRPRSMGSTAQRSAERKWRGQGRARPCRGPSSRSRCWDTAPSRTRSGRRAGQRLWTRGEGATT